MGIRLYHVPFEEKEIIENLIEYYVYDFSEYLDIDFNENGKFGFYSLEKYWSDKINHFPFFIMLEDQIIGFVLVKKMNKDGKIVNTIAEFFVTRKYRRQGHGESAAKQILDRFRGEWEITQIEKNLPAQAFWRNVISQYTLNTYEGHFYDKKYHQSFVN